MAGSNNYLGLSWDPRVKEAAIAATRKWGTSCSGSRFLNGTLALHEELEDHLARFVGKQRALCFTTGYQTNLGAISALLGKDEHVFSDKLNHASIMDGIFLATGHARQGEGPPLPAQRHGEPGEVPLQGASRRAQAGGHRRRLQHGRGHREAPSDARAVQEVRRPAVPGRGARHRRAGIKRTRHGGALRGQGQDRRRDVHVLQVIRVSGRVRCRGRRGDRLHQALGPAAAL